MVAATAPLANCVPCGRTLVECVLLSGSGLGLPVPAWAGSTMGPWWSGSASQPWTARRLRLCWHRRLRRSESAAARSRWWQGREAGRRYSTWQVAIRERSNGCSRDKTAPGYASACSHGGGRVSSRRRQRCIKIRPNRLSAGPHQGTATRPATSGTRDNRAPTRLACHAVPGSAVSVLRSWHAFPPFAFFASLHRRAVGLAGDTSSEFLHPRFRGQEMLRTRAVHGSCRDVGMGDGRNPRAAMPA